MAMRNMFRGITIAVAAAGVLAVGSWAVGVTAGQVTADKAGSAHGNSATTRGTAGTWTAPRTPWGDPHLQGIWDGRSMTPLQRPEKFRDREYVTEEEAVAMEKEAAAAPGRNARAKPGT